MTAGSPAVSPWTWHAHPDAWLLIATLLVGYFLALRVLGPSRVPVGRPVATRRQQMFFLSGVFALWVGADWPIHDISEDYLFSVHMVQHTIFSLVAPPLLLLGFPPWLLRAMLPLPVLQVVRWLTRPAIAFVIFNGVVVITHWPLLVDSALRSEPLHFVIHAVLVGSALLMWWPVVAPLPETSRLSEPGKMLYVFLQSILPTVPASFLTFASAPIYHFYEAVPRAFGISVVDDQRVAGLIMKIGGGLLLWLVIAVLFFRWQAKERSGEIEVIGWEDFERELQVWDMRR